MSCIITSLMKARSNHQESSTTDVQAYTYCAIQQSCLTPYSNHLQRSEKIIVSLLSQIESGLKLHRWIKQEKPKTLLTNAKLVKLQKLSFQMLFFLFFGRRKKAQTSANYCPLNVPFLCKTLRICYATNLIVNTINY